LRVVECDDAKIEPVSVILSSDPDNHIHLLHVLLFPIHQFAGISLSSWFTHQIAVSSPPFFTFPNVDECYARIICNLVLRLQPPIIHLTRDKTPELYGKAVCEKKSKRRLDERRDINYIECQENSLSFSDS